MGILSWIIFGLIAGILAKWIMPGKDGGGFFMTILLVVSRCRSRRMDQHTVWLW